MFSTDAGIYKSEKIQQAFRKEMEFKEKGCIPEANLEEQGW